MRQRWIASPGLDLAFIIGPAFLVSAFVLLFHDKVEAIGDTPPWMWLLLVVGIDVSHVYSTVFRTYLDRAEMQKRQTLYIMTPLLAWIAGVLLYSIDMMVFWRALAYLALFHFIRQQYGFMMLYAGKTPARWLDKFAVYAATVYPVIDWHLAPREFNWFIKGDFVALHAESLRPVVFWIYVAIIAAYVAKELYQWHKTRQFSIPKNLLLLGTALSWYVGIVAFNNDIAFTATNVVAHGIPYLFLIWLYGRNTQEMKKENYAASWIGRLFAPRMILLYVLLLVLAAGIEEGAWDLFVWHERFKVDVPSLLVWIVPLLALPQVVHYILDAVIWKHDLKDSEWTKILFYKKEASA